MAGNDIDGGAHKPGEITVKDAIEKLKSSKEKSRAEGLADLKHIFSYRKNPKLAILSDKSYHSIYEQLFRIIIAEKHTYLRAKPTPQARSLTKLTEASKALRLAVEIGAPKLKKKTVKATIDHVIQTLPNAGGKHCAPLSQDYLKILRAVLSHKPHVESLPEPHWELVVKFCIDGINHHCEEWSLSTRDMEELMYCLLALVSAPESPVLKHASSISSDIMQVLRVAQATSLGTSHQVALSILNIVLASMAAEQTALCKAIAKELVPLITRLWPTKEASAKDEMLSLLYGMHLHLESAVCEASCGEDLEVDIRYLSDVIKLEYSKRLDRDSKRLDSDQLQLEHIDLTTLERAMTTTAPLRFLRLRPHNLHAERNWMLLKAVGILDRLGHMKKCGAKTVEEDVERHTRKRRRVTQHVDEFIDTIKSSKTSKRLTALQTLPFILQMNSMPSKGLGELVEYLVSLMNDDSSIVASWAMLGIASCTTQAKVHENERLFDWTQIWHIGARLVTSSAYCRAACHLLHVLLAQDLVKYLDVAEEISAMVTSPELSGPAILADSTISLMTHLLYIRNMEMPGPSSTASQNVIRWAFTRWNPIDDAERNSGTSMTRFTEPIDFINLLRVCLAMPRLKLATSKTTPCTPIGQAWLRISASRDMLRYLLLLEDNGTVFEQCSTCPTTTERHDSERFVGNIAHVQNSRKTILELCSPKFEDLGHYWDTSIADNSKRGPTVAISGTLFAFLVGSYIVSLLGMVDSRNFPELKKHVDSLGSRAVSFTRDGGSESQMHDEMLLQAIHPYLPSCQSLASAEPSLEDSCFLRFLHQYAEGARNRHSAVEDSQDGYSDADDMMLSDDEVDSRQRGSKAEPLNDLPREQLSLATSSKAFSYCTSLHIVLVSAIATSQAQAGSVPSLFLEYFLSLRPAETLFCRNLLQDVFQSELVVDDADATRLLSHYADMLENSDYSNCEIVQGICLDILLGTAAVWTNSEEETGEYAELASDMYKMFTKSALKCSLSLNVMVGVATLLIQLMNFISSLPPPSPLTCLLGVLQHAEIRVKFHIGARLPEIFGLFVLKEHERIINDVIEHLPVHQDFNEGIAFRMHVFALLGAEWTTLVRRCVYHIFECPGRFPECSNHAARCFAHVSGARGLESPRDLFRLFASQLLFTWLEDEEIGKMPFRTLGYATFLDLVQDVRVDITAIMMMRAQNLEILSKLLGIPTQDLLKQSFTKVMAYTTFHDCSGHTTEGVARGGVRVKDMLGQDEYLKYIQKHFVDIIALLFSIVDQNGPVDRLFSENDSLTNARIAMDEIKQRSNSQLKSLPANHQPALNPKYFYKAISSVCSRTHFDQSQIYTPTLVSFTVRKLFDLIHPALGSLHACAVLRKVRILICMAGPAALKGYPLDMLLQSFRPYLAEPECLEDAIGVMQYLFVQGLPHLLQSPSFVTGISLSILASLRAFSKISQASTTQESQHKAMMSKAEEFHDWFGNYLRNYDSPLMSESSKESFQEIINAAHNIRTAGTADLDSPESNLLVGLLEDERSGSPLLSRPSRDSAFALLCSEFSQPDSYRTDVFGSHETATKHAAAVWCLCRGGSVSTNFLAWGAKVIGRAFVANGHIHEELLRESEIARIKELSASEKFQSTSSSSIFRLLQMLILGNDQKEVGLAESTLRVIMSTLEGLEDQTDFNECQQRLSDPLCTASLWGSFEIPPSDDSGFTSNPRMDPFSADAITCKTWLEDLSIALCLSETDDVVLFALPRLLQNVTGFAEQAFPFILHSVLLNQFDEKPTVKKELSAALRHWLNYEGAGSRRNVKLLLNAILYLRTQTFPHEISHADRMKWLDINYSEAGRAAMRCNMFKTALLFTEIDTSSTTSKRTSRRSSAVKDLTSPDFLLSIFRSIDDPDSFYGVPQDASLSSVLSRLEYEKDGFKSLSFRGAQYDSNLRGKHPDAASDADSLVNALGVLRLDGLSHSLVSAKQTVGMSSESRESMFRTARKLEQWDIPVPEISLNDSSTIYRAFQVLNNAVDRKTIAGAIDDGLRKSMNTLVGEGLNASALHSSLQSLSILIEMDEVLSSKSSEEFEEMIHRFEDRAGWMKTGRFDDISHIMSCRETLLSSLSQRQSLRDILKIGAADSRLVEVRAMLLASGISRAHGALQESLASATYMTRLIQPCNDVGITIDAAVNLEAANALWELGEMSSSIGMLHQLSDLGSDLKSQTVKVSKSELLAKLGYQVSTARLETPDRIIANYLQPALAELGKSGQEKIAGRVYHEFAAFCDQQLQDPAGIEELERLRKLREERQSEVSELSRISRTEPKKRNVSKALGEAKQWYQIDNSEFTRLSESRAGFLRQSLENYLLTLAVSENHDKDALRFSALWFEHSDAPIANQAVHGKLDKVPTRKFAPLMNQLTSRLLDRDEPFQKLLAQLVLRACRDHPYHGMYQICAGTKYTGSTNQDETALARLRATKNLAAELKKTGGSGVLYSAIEQTSKAYCSLADDDGSRRRGERYKASQRIAISQSPQGSQFLAMLLRSHIPPPTMHIDIAVDCNYSDLPIIAKVEPNMEIASGISAPKVVTVLASNGRKYKQLVKGGNDDLRQDAIMEQVFTQVSTILQSKRATRQRNLIIRTYKIIPLSNKAGIIEFVPNSMPLLNFLGPAHPRYYPKDMSSTTARKHISDVQNKSQAERLRVYKHVTERFHPVMRYFFMERFDDPDEWFSRRLAYTRSTAANSMVGHILGIGDRHGHNILLDEKTGEAVHIDFGFAFDAGRVLPVPELVPFRLTRDVIDGMGITGTEGVFRRCCEFTLEALREESYSIMTVLDVLRYDPLYSWTTSPYRVARMQKEQHKDQSTKSESTTDADAEESVVVGGKGRGKAGGGGGGGNEPHEANRALTVVAKKLAKTLSVEATVNDLINQATDERNLAVLYVGWAAYA